MRNHLNWKIPEFARPLLEEDSTDKYVSILYLILIVKLVKLAETCAVDSFLKYWKRFLILWGWNNQLLLIVMERKDLTPSTKYLSGWHATFNHVPLPSVANWIINFPFQTPSLISGKSQTHNNEVAPNAQEHRMMHNIIFLVKHGCLVIIWLLSGSPKI